MPYQFKLLISLNSTYTILLLFAYFFNFTDAVSVFSIITSALLLAVNLGHFQKFRLDASDVVVVYFLCIGCIFHLLFSPYINYSDFTKFLLIFLFYFLGRNVFFSGPFTLNFKSSSWLFGFFPLLIIFPIVCLCVYLAQSYMLGDTTGNILFFSNRNNAIAFTFVAFFVLSVFGLNKKPLYVGLTIFTLLYSTLGALLAFILSSIVINLKISFKTTASVIFLSVCGFLIFSYSNLPVFSRIETMMHGLFNFFETYSFDDIAMLSFSDFSALQAGSSDVSMFFRFKHWVEIMSIASRDLFLLIPGWGMNASIELTNLKLVPHNDWLRILFELGIFSFLSFLFLFFSILNKLKRISKSLCTIFLCVNIYYLTENIINNFLITSIFYFSVGMVIAHENTQRRA